MIDRFKCNGQKLTKQGILQREAKVDEPPNISKHTLTTCICMTFMQYRSCFLSRQHKKCENEARNNVATMAMVQISYTDTRLYTQRGNSQ